MIEKEVAIPTKYGTQPAFAVCPSEPGMYAPVILFMDAPGIREELRNMARRIARAGYYCLLPDLYYRLGTLRFDVPRRNEAMSVLIRGAMAACRTPMCSTTRTACWVFWMRRSKRRPALSAQSAIA
ncbi:dienelactone hydrolase family protein [Paraburkholderia graminis]|uniref:Dienelactone hydrolase domain-containing protein n=1 Tax=Paraburkholderia graminis (strain ATCC 700544 / DSM 17151 / LMG 18924 / NCIMB 13744 / C4D1M) TaxID=396598 RepID=B1FYD6_PARG4|nr:dienelactone hydrolase family protein [Paraburkholderia graminis]EDT10777.1 hypothetical protein BgramDRAFT_2154 [Paraburkholderia graminis C4D1M]